MQTRPFVPAAGHDAALPFYDPLTALFGAHARRQLLIDRAKLQPGLRVLDVGCGTGTLAVAIKRAHPRVEVVGIDPDPLALARARKKAARAGVEVRFEQGYGDALPYAEGAFARVLSSFMLHHVERALQQRLLAEALRVLECTGSVHVTDFARDDRQRGTAVLCDDLVSAGFSEVWVEPRPRWLWQPTMYGEGKRR